MDFAIHDTDSGNPHCHIMLTMRPLDERGAWAAKSKKEYDLDENGERIRLPSGRYKTHKIDLTGWNDKDNTLLWRRAWADYTNDFLERNGSPERIDHRSNAERGIDEIPTVHMGVAACQIWSLGIHDKTLSFIIKRILTAPIKMPDNTTVLPDKGTPQGGIISPLLANIVLNELDWWIASQWEEKAGTGSKWRLTTAPPAASPKI